MANVNDKLQTYLEGLYIPVTFAAADLATLIQHHLGTLSGGYTARFQEMLTAAEAS